MGVSGRANEENLSPYPTGVETHGALSHAELGERGQYPQQGCGAPWWGGSNRPTHHDFFHLILTNLSSSSSTRTPVFIHEAFGDIEGFLSDTYSDLLQMPREFLARMFYETTAGRILRKRSKLEYLLPLLSTFG